MITILVEFAFTVFTNFRSLFDGSNVQSVMNGLSLVFLYICCGANVPNGFFKNMHFSHSNWKINSSFRRENSQNLLKIIKVHHGPHFRKYAEFPLRITYLFFFFDLTSQIKSHRTIQIGMAHWYQLSTVRTSNNKDKPYMCRLCSAQPNRATCPNS